MSHAIGSLEAQVKVLSGEVSGLKDEMFNINSKLDRMLAEQQQKKGFLMGAAGVFGILGGAGGAKVAKIIGLLSVLTLILTAVQGCQPQTVPSSLLIVPFHEYSLPRSA